MLTDPPAGVVSVRVFGSTARGDATSESDLDVLAILADGVTSSDRLKDKVAAFTRTHFHKLPSVSFYGQDRLKQIFAQGDLFAWHLHLESFRLTSDDDVLDLLGCPAPYSTGRKDMDWFVDILQSSEEALARTPSNRIYEAGIVFVCLRNIGIIASWYAAGRPKFDKLVAFEIGKHIGIPLQLSEVDFAVLNRCRVLGGRGLPIEPPTLDELRTVQAISIDWARNVRCHLFEKGRG